ncbi:YchJ family protein [Deinococcus lacus]|uniref:YchJ family protein n=1 Tax=Deinococcus lacus TaxID=392561 RepID=A0ABW1YED8_9DEIO
MRSRYSAYALADADYVQATWHPDTCPATLDLADGTRYLGLRIHRAGPDTVEFTADLRGPGGERFKLREHSRFVQWQGRWVYLDALEEGQPSAGASTEP